jgi:hypothetical protein
LGLESVEKLREWKLIRGCHPQQRWRHDDNNSVEIGRGATGNCAGA